LEEALAMIQVLRKELVKSEAETLRIKAEVRGLC
jgi:hypothetical protein